MRRMPRAVWAAAGVVALAGVIFAFGALSQPSQGSRGSRDDVVDSTALLRQADERLASGDASSAAGLARRVLAADPDNAHAQLVLKQAGVGADDAAAADPESEETTPAGENPAPAEVDDDAFGADVEDLAGLLPTDFQGYSMGFVAAVGDDVDISATPDELGMDAFRIQWSVRDRRSAQGAEAYILKTSKVLYAKASNDSVVIDGARAYFGTDGRELATVVYRRGRHVFEVVVVAERPGSPEKLRPLAEKAARAFADSPVR